MVQRQVLEPQVLALAREPVLARVADVLSLAQVEVLRAGQAEFQDEPRLQVRLPLDVMRKGPAAVAELPA